MKLFPVRDPETTTVMLADIATVIQTHLGFIPACFVLILTDGEQAQTLFAGDDARDFTRLLTEGADIHRRSRQQ